MNQHKIAHYAIRCDLCDYFAEPRAAPENGKRSPTNSI